MNKQEYTQDIEVQQIYAVLAAYKTTHPNAKIDVRRRHEVSIHIRIIDPDFHGVRWANRENEIWPLLGQLPYETFVNITVLLLLTPTEEATSLANMAFENPISWSLSPEDEAQLLVTPG